MPGLRGGLSRPGVQIERCLYNSISKYWQGESFSILKKPQHQTAARWGALYFCSRNKKRSIPRGETNQAHSVSYALTASAWRRLLFYNSCVDPLREFGRILLLLGVLLAAIGALLYFGGKLPLRLGRLPGDIVHRGEHTTFYFPLVTCLLLSVGLSLLFWLFTHLRK